MSPVQDSCSTNELCSTVRIFTRSQWTGNYMFKANNRNTRRKCEIC